MLPEITQYIQKQWNLLFSTFPHPDNISYLAIPGAGEGGTVTFLAFLDSEKQPAFTIKVHRDYDSENRAQTEVSVLKQLKSIPSIAPTVPEIICVESFGKNWMLIQTVVKGKAMEIRIGPRILPSSTLAARHFKVVTDWLIVLGVNTQNFNTSQKYFHTILDKAKRTFIFSESEKRFLKKLENRFSKLNGYGVLVQHGDFCSQNIFLLPYYESFQINVIDWSDSSLKGLPLADLLFFLTTYSLKSRKETGISGLIHAFETTFFDSNPYSYKIWEALNLYIQTFQISLSDLPFLMSTIFLQQACYEHDKLKYASNYGTLPLFTLALAKESHSNFQNALKQIPWFYFFRVLVKHYNTNSSFGTNFKEGRSNK